MDTSLPGRWRLSAPALAALLAAVPTAWSQTATLPDLIRSGLEHNRLLAAHRQEAGTAAFDTLAVATALNPSLEAEALHNLSDPSRPAAAVKLSKEFRPGDRGRFKAAAKAGYAVREARLKAEELDLVTAIRGSYHEWLVQDRKAALQREVIARWESLSKLAAGQVAQGRISEVDLIQAKLNASRARQKELSLLAERDAVGRRLGLLAGRTEPSVTLDSLPLESLPALPPSDSLQAWAGRTHPDLVALELEVEAEKKHLVLDEGRARPSFHLSAGYERTDEGNNLVGGGFEVPLAFGNRNQAEIRKARSELRAAELRQAAGRERIRTEVAASHGLLESLAARYLHYRNQVKDLARKQMDLSEKGFRQGMLGVFDLSRVQEEYLSQEGEALDILDEYYHEWHRLGRAVGGKLW